MRPDWSTASTKSQTRSSGRSTTKISPVPAFPKPFPEDRKRNPLVALKWLYH